MSVGPAPRLPTFHETLRRKLQVIRSAQNSFAQAFRKLDLDKSQVRRWLLGEEWPSVKRMQQIDALYEWCHAKAKRTAERRHIRHLHHWALNYGPKLDEKGHPVPLPKKLPRRSQRARQDFKLPEAPAVYRIDEKFFEDGKYDQSESGLDVSSVRERPVADNQPLPMQ